jgi:hypothetical protein
MSGYHLRSGLATLAARPASGLAAIDGFHLIRQGLTAEMFQRKPRCILSASRPQVEEWSTSRGDFI